MIYYHIEKGWDKPRTVKPSPNFGWWLYTDCEHPAQNIIAGSMSNTDFIVWKEEEKHE